MPATETLKSLDGRVDPTDMSIDSVIRDLTELRSRDALKTQFLSNISHDLRTPLTAIITHAEILRDQMLGPINERQQESINGIISGGRQLLEMVSEILTFAKGAANRLTLDINEFSVRDIVEEIAKVSEALLGKHNLTLEIRVDPEMPRCLGDKEKIRHVIGNLIGNAIEFTPAGGKIWVDGTFHSDPAGNVIHQIEIGDTGIGIDPAHFDLIFREFAQVDASAARRHHGTGLGLTIARRFVELHGGQIWLNSTVGEGSQFYFTLPQQHLVDSEPEAG